MAPALSIFPCLGESKAHYFLVSPGRVQALLFLCLSKAGLFSFAPHPPSLLYDWGAPLPSHLLAGRALVASTFLMFLSHS